MKISAYFLTILPALFAALPASVQAATITFDLSGQGVTDSRQATTLTLPGTAGTVTSVEWDFTITTVGESWRRDVSIELVSPEAVENTRMGGPTGLYPQAPGNPGTFIWGRNHEGIAPDFLLGWSSGAGSASSSSSTTALNGFFDAGTWTINLFDEYNDGGGQFSFNPGSFITIHYTPAAVPEPASVAALAGLGALGLVSLRRKRRAA